MKMVYALNDVAVNAFILKGGELEFSLPSGDTFPVSGENLIFGAEEILLGWEFGTLTNRLMAANASDDSGIVTIPKENLKKSLEHYNVGFNITREIARSLRSVNSIFQERITALSQQEKCSQEYAKGYAAVVDRIHEEFSAKRFPMLKEIYDEFANSLTYNYGISFQKVTRKTMIDLEGKALDSLLRTYKQHETVCRQGDAGEELYILKKGVLGIYIGENEKPIAMITKSGEVIGEMSLLLKEPRTATIRAEEDSLLSVVRKDDLKTVAESKPDFFTKLGLTISQRLVESIGSLKNLADHTNQVLTPESLISHPHRDAFSKLERKISNAFRENDLPVLGEIHELVRYIKNNIK